MKILLLCLISLTVSYQVSAQESAVLFEKVTELRVYGNGLSYYVLGIDTDRELRYYNLGSGSVSTPECVKMAKTTMMFPSIYNFKVSPSGNTANPNCYLILQ